MSDTVTLQVDNDTKRPINHMNIGNSAFGEQHQAAATSCYC
jgi:hypothetical protein